MERDATVHVRHPLGENPVGEAARDELVEEVAADQIVAAVDVLLSLVGEPALLVSEPGAADTRRVESEELDERDFFSSSEPEGFVR